MHFGYDLFDRIREKCLSCIEGSASVWNGTADKIRLKFNIEVFLKIKNKIKIVIELLDF